MTLAELWFDLNTDYELIWPQRDQEIPERERYTIQLEKMIPTIYWNPNDFHLINVAAKAFKFNASYNITPIRCLPSDWHTIQLGRTNRKLVVHDDGAVLTLQK